MDNLCHTLAGAALGRAGLGERTRFGSATLMLASNLPDLDVLVFLTGSSAVAFRRGWTHGVVAQGILPLLLAAVMYVAATRGAPREGRASANGLWLVILSYIGVLLHVGMDLLNNYGVRLLMPIQPRWFYGDVLFIIDPWLWLMLGAGVWLARRQHHPRPARGALIASLLYVALMLVSARAARDAVTETWRTLSGEAPRAFMVGPLPATPLSRAVIIDAGDRYVTGTFAWTPSEVRFDPESVPKNDGDPRVAMARAAPDIRAFLVWSRFPFWTLEPMGDGSTRVSVGDMRFAGQAGRFGASTVVAAGE